MFKYGIMLVVLGPTSSPKWAQPKPRLHFYFVLSPPINLWFLLIDHISNWDNQM